MDRERDKYSVVGKNQPKLDGPLKATGKSQFTDDLVLQNMLYGKIVRSSVPRAKILNIDTTEAERLPGVKAIVTHKDAPNLMMITGEPLLAGDRVNYVGDEIAAVAAIDEDTAYEAAELVKVEYEPLPAVLNLAEATAEGAPVIHEGYEGNCVLDDSFDYGDVDKAFSEAEYVREGEYTSSPTQNCFAEHHVVIADFSLPGKLSVWTPNQSEMVSQKEMAAVLGISESNVRIIIPNTGGAFSGRIGPRNHHYIAAVLSRKASRPVKIWSTADEEFIVYRSGAAEKFRIRIGAMKDGALKAIKIDWLIDNGAYMDLSFKYAPGPRVDTATVGFKLEGLRLRFRNFSTNNVPRIYHHGGGITGLKFAVESSLNLVAQDIGMDPMELRLKNAVKKGDTHISKIYFSSCGLKECIQKTSNSSGWKQKYGKLPLYRGIGIALGGASSGGRTMFQHDTSAAFLKIGEDGKMSVLTGIPDMGQGTHTLLAMVAAETLGVLTEDVTVKSGDTDIDPFDIGAFGQRGTLVTGNAVKAASLDARKQLEKTASNKLGVDPADLIFRERKVYAKDAPDKSLSFADVVQSTLHSEEGRYVMGRGFYSSPSPTGIVEALAATPAFSFGAQIAEVEVDPETGIVKLLKMTVAHDVGFAINPIAVEEQLDGQVFSGMGQALSEERIQEQGLVLNPSFLDYKLARPFEVPEMERIIVESIDPYGPFGAKEVGEGPIMATPGAIAGAVSNAIGYPITEIPITPEVVLRALRQKEKKRG